MKAVSFCLVTKCLVPVSDVPLLPQDIAVCRWGKKLYTPKSLLGSSQGNCAIDLQSQFLSKRKIIALCNLPVHLHDITWQQRDWRTGMHQCPACRKPALCAKSLRDQVNFCALCSTEKEHLYESLDLLLCSVAILAVLSHRRDKDTHASLALRELELSVIHRSKKKKRKRKEITVMRSYWKSVVGPFRKEMYGYNRAQQGFELFWKGNREICF